MNRPCCSSDRLLLVGGGLCQRSLTPTVTRAGQRARGRASSMASTRRSPTITSAPSPRRRRSALYLLAEMPSVVSPRTPKSRSGRSPTSTAPIGRARNEPVPGVLEVVQNGSVVAEIEADRLHHPLRAEDGVTTAELFLGEEAIAAHARFEARQAAFQEEANAYFEAERAWQAAAAEAEERRRAGEPVEVPPAPLRPDPIGIFSNGLNQGMPIDLEPGTYAIRLRGEDGGDRAGQRAGADCLRAATQWRRVLRGAGDPLDNARCIARAE